MSTVPSESQPPEPTPPLRSPRERTFRTNLLLACAALVLLTGGLVAYLSHRSARASSRALAEALFREVSGNAVTQTRAFVLRAEPLAQSVGRMIEAGVNVADPDQAARLLLAVLEANQGLSWVSYADTTGRFTGALRTPEGVLRINQSHIEGGRTRLLERDVMPDGSWRVSREDPDSGYDPRTRPYYLRAIEAGRLTWLPPYVFFTYRVPGISCARPVYDRDGSLRGVVSIDFDLNALSSFVSAQRLSPNSELFLFTNDLLLLAHSDRQRVERVARSNEGSLLSVKDFQDPLADALVAGLSAADTNAGTADRFRSADFKLAGVEYMASTTAFRVGNDLTWVIGAVAPQRDFLPSVWETEKWAFAGAAGALLGALVLAGALARRISRPVHALIGFMRRVGGGDLSGTADFGGSREFRELSHELNRMIEDLRDRLRLRHTLQVAMDVQQRLLPREAPKVRGFDIAGHSTYCDETGGDYYDFLVVEGDAPGRVLVALGDVMGHGVAAALVMAGARAVLRDRAVHARGMGELLSRLNQHISSDLHGERFMTMHLALFDASTRTVRWASAGHDPAIMYDPATDSFDEPEQGGVPLGILNDSDYEEYFYTPQRPGQVIVIGTDGIWESRNDADEFFGKDRLRAAIRGAGRASAAEIKRAILDAMAAFLGPARPADDVTFVIVKVEAA